VRNIWNVRSGLLDTLENFFMKLDVISSTSGAILTDASLTLVLESLLEGSLRDFKYVSIRNQGLQLVKNIIAKLKGKKAYAKYPRCRNLCCGKGTSITNIACRILC
jgi:proteasome component ECM29